MTEEKLCSTCKHYTGEIKDVCLDCGIFFGKYKNWESKTNTSATQEQMSWDEYFLNIAEAVSLRSKDQSSKIGAVIVGPGHEIRSTGYNGFPRGMNDDDIAKQERPLKYKYFEHAERNSIYNAARFGASIEGCTMYCPWPPCSDCARAIIQAGIKKLVVKHGILMCPQRWHEDMVIAADMLRECGVKFEVCNE